MRGPAYVELNFRPNVDLISVARRFVSDFYEEILADPDATSRVALATHELLENAVKYAIDGTTTLRIEVTRKEVGSSVKISTRNRTTPGHVATLQSTFDEMHGEPDAFAFYQRLMHKNARRQGGSGLGLARIRAEGEMSMTCEFEADYVSILAETQIEAGRAA